jgi:hypothetical protein
MMMTTIGLITKRIPRTPAVVLTPESIMQLATDSTNIVAAIATEVCSSVCQLS